MAHVHVLFALCHRRGCMLLMKNTHFGLRKTVINTVKISRTTKHPKDGDNLLKTKGLQGIDVCPCLCYLHPAKCRLPLVHLECILEIAAF